MLEKHKKEPVNGGKVKQMAWILSIFLMLCAFKFPLGDSDLRTNLRSEGYFFSLSNEQTSFRFAQVTLTCVRLESQTNFLRPAWPTSLQPFNLIEI